MNYLYKTAFFILTGFLASYICQVIGSDYLRDFLSSQLVGIIITLMAINTATCSFLIAKLDDLKKGKPIDFSKTTTSIKNSLIEQVIIMSLAIVIGVLSSSKTINYNNINSDLIFTSLRCAIFINTIQILNDTGLLMFDIFESINTNKNEE